MRRALPLLLAVALTLACGTLPLRPTATPPPTVAPTSTLAPTPLPTATRPPTAVPTPAVEAEPADLYIGPGDVIFHPEPALYSGDQVSFEVFAHDGARMGLSGFPVAVYLGHPDEGQMIATVRVTEQGLDNRLQATFLWAWNTAGLEGPQTLTVVVDPTDEIQIGDEDPGNNTLTVTVELLPRAALPLAEGRARWRTAESACCIFHYISGTAAERDLRGIQATADKAMAYVEQRMGRRQQSKIVFNLINRVLGHGGFAADTITITYVDRDYVGGGLENVFRHEAAHVLDRQARSTRPTLITEGLATYVAGGHFKPEPFEPRMVGLLALDRYLPLAQLADSFYPSQHEIGYLEAAAFIEYLVGTYGWDRFAILLGSFQPAPSESLMLDAGLRLAYGQGLAELESDWLAQLRARPAEAAWTADVASTIALYDTVRRYQQTHDPSAYFLHAWIPDINRAVQHNIVADYSRHPSAPENIALETLLIEAGQALGGGDYDGVRRYLEAVNAVLDADGNFGADALAADHLALATSALHAGYEPQRIRLTSDAAAVVVARRSGSPAQIELTVTRVSGVWQVN